MHNKKRTIFLQLAGLISYHDRNFKESHATVYASLKVIDEEHPG